MLKQLNKCSAWYNHIMLKSYDSVVAFYKDGVFYMWRYPSMTTAKHFHKWFRCDNVNVIFETLYHLLMKHRERFGKIYTGKNGLLVYNKIDSEEYFDMLYNYGH